MRQLLVTLLLLFLPTQAVLADSFPVRITHQFGETEIPAQPRRIVSVGYHEQDFLYALGLAPVGVHEWFGGFPFATWPWAGKARRALSAEPDVQHGFEIDIEWVLARDPDLIVATFAPLDARTYALLSQIAPVVGPPKGYPAWGAPWEAELRLIGAAAGRGDAAERVIARLDRRLAGLAKAHPQLSGLSGTAAHFSGGQIVGYRSSDGANRLLARLGVETPAEFENLAGPGGNFSVSPERLDIFDLDVVLWLTDVPSRDRIEAFPGYNALRITREGRSVWAGRLLMGAMSFQSPLSIDWALDRLVPALQAAADGDPATQVPQAEAAPGG